MDLEFTTIKLSVHQADFLAWCNQHYHQLVELRKSSCLDKPFTNFTVHLKEKPSDIVPPLIEVIDLNDKWRPAIDKIL